jgi:hypothetical protein
VVLTHITDCICGLALVLKPEDALVRDVGALAGRS